MDIFLLILVLALLGVIAWLLFRRPSTNSNHALEEAFRRLSEQQGTQLQQTTSLVLQQLSRQQEAQDRSGHLMHTRIDTATKVVSEVQGKLMQLQEANQRIFELGKDISSLQKILQAPKLRGGMGEIWLAELISQIMPADRYKMQYSFKQGEICDAVIFLRDGTLLPIDSKFSLENFTKMLEAEEAQQPLFRRQFASDTKKRVDEIARKYIRPNEGTLEFAFMYVPAENVYYRAFIHDEDELHLLAYAFERKVIPVSPSSFYAYLQVILFGLRGLEIERGAKEIQKNLSGLQGEFGRFRESYEKMGTHMRHAQQAYDQSDRRLVSMEGRLDQLHASTPDSETAALPISNE